jgi:hypothetical protein
MDARRCGLALAFVLAACTPPKAQPNGEFVEHGRQYTAWLYGNEYNKLWDRFSPEMRQTFGSVGDLATFASRALTQLGPERRLVDESVQDADPLVVYTRDASFDKSRQRMLIEWSLARDGAVTGLVVRPSPDQKERKQ